MIRAGIIGGAGYTAGELIRLLVNHPQVRLAFVHSTSNAGNRIADVHADWRATPNCASPTPATSRRSTSCSSVRRTARAANGSKRTTFPPA